MTGARYPDLEGAAVLITGGGSGIGASIVEAFAGQGARVAFLEINPAAAEATAAASGGRTVHRIVDLVTSRPCAPLSPSSRRSSAPSAR